MAWRLARSLVTLRNEVRALFPGTTVWDIGDEAHRGTWSDHNPNQCCDVVCAIDVLANGGMNLGWFAEKVRQSNHRALKYVIYNRRIWSKARADEGWRPYRGSNPHTGHVHVSVGVGPDGRSTGPYDDTSPWRLRRDDMTSAEMDTLIKRLLSYQLDVWDENNNRGWRAARSVGVTSKSKMPTFGQWLQWGGEVGHLTHNRVLPALARIEATINVMAGQDVVAAVRQEFEGMVANLGEIIRDEIEDASEEQVERVFRRVLGSVDEGLDG